MSDVAAEFTKQLIELLLRRAEDSFKQSKPAIQKTETAAELMGELARALRNDLLAGVSSMELAERFDSKACRAIADGLVAVLWAAPRIPSGPEKVLRDNITVAVAVLAEVEVMLWGLALREPCDDVERVRQAGVRLRQAGYNGHDIAVLLPGAAAGLSDDLGSAGDDDTSGGGPAEGYGAAARMGLVEVLTNLADRDPAIREAADVAKRKGMLD